MKKKILFEKRCQLITGMLLAFALLIAVIPSAITAAPGSEFDIAIKNGLIFDGTGKAGYKADIGITDGKIVSIGTIAVVDLNETVTVIDAAGAVVAPGFIDIHSHADFEILTFPTAENTIFQGITTVLGGNCGGSVFPIGEFLKELEETGISLNVAILVGHGNIRREAMEDPYVALPTDAELLVMQDLVKQAMKEGAFGISTGLEYMPGRAASTEELIVLAEKAGQFGGFYATHMRSEVDVILAAVAEAIEIGVKSGTPVQISHIKACGPEQWGQGAIISAMILQARALLGVDITADQYPYDAWYGDCSWLFPVWALEGGTEELIKRLEDPVLYDLIWEYVRYQIKINTGEDMSKRQIASYEYDLALEGKTFAEVLIDRGLEPTLDNGADLMIELFKHGVGCIGFGIHEDDIRVFMRNPYIMLGSDGSVRQYGKGSPHPRNYGAFPRYLSRYVNDQRILTIEEAIRRMTSLPAERMGLEDRGVIKEGNWADIVIFDELGIKDTATFKNPHQYPEGIHYVIVNGVVTTDHGNHTGAKAGMALYGPGTQ